MRFHTTTRLAMVVLSAAALVAATGAAGAATVYTWTGLTNGDWTNAGNWDASGVPVDGNADAGLTFAATDDRIVFSATTLPTSNIPDLGGRNVTAGHTPVIDLRSGGTLAINSGMGGLTGNVTNTSGITRTLLFVGDGIGGGGEDVTLNVTHNGALIRHEGSSTTHNFTVKSDGTLNFTSNVDFTSETANPRYSTFTIAGGAVAVSGTVTDLDNVASNFVDFTASGGSFTANYGSDFANIAAVNAQVGPGLSFRSSALLTLQTVDNGGSFTINAGGPVTLIDEDFAAFTTSETYAGNAVTWADNDTSPTHFERYTPPSPQRQTDGTYDHDDNPGTPDVTLAGAIEVNDAAGNVTLTGSFTLPDVGANNALELEFGADSRNGTSYTSTVEIENVTDGRFILPATLVVYDMSAGGPDWKRNLLTAALSGADDAGDTIELRFIATGGGGDGLQITNLSLKAVPEPATGALAAIGLLGLRRQRRRRGIVPR